MNRRPIKAPDRAPPAATAELRHRIARELENHGLKGTPQRMLVAQLRLKAPRHLTAEQILKELKGGGHRVSKATVYNTLNMLSEHGLIREINLGGDHTVYDSTSTPHHHFHNVDTGELFDIRMEQLDLQCLPPLPEGTEATGVEVVIRIRQRVR
jgi:Fur family transcriptional regulator, iron response regulator